SAAVVSAAMITPWPWSYCVVYHKVRGLPRTSFASSYLHEASVHAWQGGSTREGHGGGKLFAQDFQHAEGFFLAREGEAVGVGAADQHGPRAEGQGFEHVGATAHPAVHEDFEAVAYGFDYFGEGGDAGADRV